MTGVTFRGVLIGCGFFAQNHMHAWAEVEGAEIVAVCDRDPEKARAMGEKFSVPAVFEDAETMLREVKPDFVDVATTSLTHRPLVELAARYAGVVICQKPIADTFADAAAMVEAVETAGGRLVIHENFRWQRPFLEIGEAVKSGAIGEVNFARFSFRHGYNNYVNQPYLAEIERFTIMDVGLHLFDLARSLVGDAATLSCRTQSLNPIVRGEDSFVALIGHTGGATSIVDCSFYSKLEPHRFPQTLATVEGTLGTLELGEDYILTVHRDGTRSTRSVEPPVPAWGEKPWHIIQDSVIAFQRHVVEMLRGNADPMPSGRNNLDTLKLALAAYDAAGTDTVVDLKSWSER